MGEIIGGIIVPRVYFAVFWRIGRRSAGNRILECAGIAGCLFMVSMACMRIPGCPPEVAAAFGLLAVFAGIAMIFFLVKRGFAATRRRE
jgi:hypothetical protein